MRRYVREIFSCFSRLINALIGGSADISLSARAYRDGWKRTEAVINLVFWCLFRETDHCRTWWLVEVGRAIETTNIYKSKGTGCERS